VAKIKEGVLRIEIKCVAIAQGSNPTPLFPLTKSLSYCSFNYQYSSFTTREVKKMSKTSIAFQVWNGNKLLQYARELMSKEGYEPSYSSYAISEWTVKKGLFHPCIVRVRSSLIDYSHGSNAYIDFCSCKKAKEIAEFLRSSFLPVIEQENKERENERTP
jgi:hypothetical protein